MKPAASLSVTNTDFLCTYVIFFCCIFWKERVFPFSSNFNQQKTDELQDLQIQSRDWIEFAHGDTFDVKSNKRKGMMGDSMERCRVERR